MVFPYGRRNDVRGPGVRLTPPYNAPATLFRTGLRPPSTPRGEETVSRKVRTPFVGPGAENPAPKIEGTMLTCRNLGAMPKVRRSTLSMGDRVDQIDVQRSLGKKKARYFPTAI